MNPASDLIWPTLDHALIRIENAKDEDGINSVIATMRLTRTRTNIHRFSEQEQKKFWWMLRKKAQSLGLYKLPSDGTWRKEIASR